MIVRRGPAVVLSLGLSAAAFAMAPTAIADDGGPAKDVYVTDRVGAVRDTDPCEGESRTRLRITSDEDGVLTATGMVWSDDSNMWDWRFKHNDDLSARGEAKADPDADKSFRVSRTMVNLIGPDYFLFRAENEADGEVCKVDVYY